MMNEEIVAVLRHIFNARIDNADTQAEYFCWCDARDIIEYALAGNYKELCQYDYLQTAEENKIKGD